MSNFGLEFSSRFGGTVFSSKQALVLTYKGVWYTAKRNTIPDGSCYYGVYGFYYKPRLIAFDCAVACYCEAVPYYPNNGTTQDGWLINIYTEKEAQVRLYVYSFMSDMPNPVLNTKYGVVVYDERGRPTFVANSFYCSIENQYTMDTTTLQVQPNDTYSGLMPAVIHGEANKKTALFHPPSSYIILKKTRYIAYGLYRNGSTGTINAKPLVLHDDTVLFGHIGNPYPFHTPFQDVYKPESISFLLVDVTFVDLSTSHTYVHPNWEVYMMPPMVSVPVP